MLCVFFIIQIKKCNRFVPNSCTICFVMICFFNIICFFVILVFNNKCTEICNNIFVILYNLLRTKKVYFLKPYNNFQKG